MSTVVDELHLLQVQRLQNLLTGPVYHLQLLVAVHQHQGATVDPLQKQRPRPGPVTGLIEHLGANNVRWNRLASFTVECNRVEESTRTMSEDCYITNCTCTDIKSTRLQAIRTKDTSRSVLLAECLHSD